MAKRIHHLRDIQIGGTFHIPAMGVEGTVQHRGVGSITVRYPETVTRTGTKRDKKTGLQREVTTTRTVHTVTQWSPGTEVVPGPAPADMVRRGTTTDDAGDDASDVEVAPAPRRAQPKPQPQPKQPRGARWPVQVTVAGRYMARALPGDKRLRGAAVLEADGVALVEVKRAGAGASHVLSVQAQGAAALLNLMMGTGRGYHDAVRAFTAAGAAVHESGGVHTVDGAVAV